MKSSVIRCRPGSRARWLLAAHTLVNRPCRRYHSRHVKDRLWRRKQNVSWILYTINIQVIPFAISLYKRHFISRSSRPSEHFVVVLSAMLRGLDIGSMLRHWPSPDIAVQCSVARTRNVVLRALIPYAMCWHVAKHRADGSQKRASVFDFQSPRTWFTLITLQENLLA